MKFNFWNKEKTLKKNELIKDEVFFATMRQEEFSRIDRNGHCYLDFTGGNLFPESLLKRHCGYLLNEVYGNPHSENPTSFLSTKYVSAARQNVLDFFNADDYYCVFTANASASLQIIGECYPFSADSRFLLTADNHNSVNGIREYCKLRGGKSTYSLLNYEDLEINIPSLENDLNEVPNVSNKLFAFPAQSNVSGVKHNLDWIAYAQERGWDVLLDAAAYVPTSRLDLQQVKPDFVSVSFYKIFGYPTGLGCLLIKKDKFSKLHKPWFAGGTVSFVSVKHESYFLLNNHERFENGTVDYLGIPAITFGLEFIKGIGIDRISKRVKALSDYFRVEIEKLQHTNGLPLLKIFGPSNQNAKGGTFILNFRDKEDNVLPFFEIEAAANAEKISIRTGCFCNPGIDEVNNCLTTEDLAKYFAIGETGSYKDKINFLGKMRGAIRVSFGIATIQADIDRFVAFAKQYIDK
ncbi:MAG: aminotransferase class V-fold PLP-dependent enzyme [Chitinophagaceae bacterium]|nr:aminotransferase class V-fold PLP-dependent enzyme [Chitinophagaceae bacterium]